MKKTDREREREREREKERERGLGRKCDSGNWGGGGREIGRRGEEDRERQIGRGGGRSNKERVIDKEKKVREREKKE